MQRDSQIESVDEAPVYDKPNKPLKPKPSLFRRGLRRLLYGCLGLALAAAIVPRTPWYQEHERAQIRSVLQDWCRLSAFPEQRSGDELSVSGGTMSRGFSYSFVLAPEALAAWQTASPGFRDAQFRQQGQTRIYTIKPHEAQRCGVAIDPQSGKVSIEASWS